MKSGLRLIVLLVGLMISYSLTAQPYTAIQRCASHEYLQNQIRANPERGKSLEALERRVEKFVNAKKPDKPGNGNGGGNGGGGGGNEVPPLTRDKIYIPVIVHVVYNTNSENISDEQVKSQIRVLNEDFNKTNSEITNSSTIWSGFEGVAADSRVEFCLKEIRRKYSSKTSFTYNDAVKKSSSGGSDPVNPESHLNIWSCDLGNSLLGYAQFPGGNVNTDGVVVHYNAFGSGAGYTLFSNYNLGRTATHEVGHWLGLRHIWGDSRCGNDQVSDTPLHDGANYGCGYNNQTGNCKGKPIEMWMNYMDYSYDGCMYMFTNGQAVRMDGFIQESRSAYVLNSNSCPTGSIPTTETTSSQRLDNNSETFTRPMSGFKVYPTITRGNVNILLQSETSGFAEAQIFNQVGSVLLKKRFSVIEGVNNTTLNTETLRPGTYFIRVANSGKTHVQKIIVQ